MKTEAADPVRERHPRGLYPLFFTEMWERFSFYLIMGLLYQYLTDSERGGMGWTGVKASSIAGSYLGLVYFTPFLGGLAADRWLGCRICITAGGLFMLLGHLLLAVPGELFLYLGLCSLVVGNGLFKPNISTLVGNLYLPGSALRDAGYSIFYMGINIGAFACNFVAAIVRNQWDQWYPKRGWHAAFATAGVGMAIGLVIFWSFRRTFAHADPGPRRTAEDEGSLGRLFIACLLPAAALGTAGWFLGMNSKQFGEGGLLGVGEATTAFLFACLPVVAFYVWVWLGLRERDERSRVAALLLMCLVSVVFWAVFWLNTTALTDWAVRMTDRRPAGAVGRLFESAPDKLEMLENAPPGYFENAGPDTPLPDRDTFKVVSPEEYKALAASGKPPAQKGERIPATQAILDQIYRRAGEATTILPAGENLKLVNAELFQSIEPGFIILLTPVLVAFWSWLRGRSREPSTPAKFVLGLLLVAVSMLVMLGAVYASRAGSTETKTSAWWLTGTYAVVTLGELCLSPMGLSLVSKNSPAKIRSFMMGGWFVATAIGGKLSGVFGEFYQKWPHDVFFIRLAACAAVAAVVLLCLLPWLKRRLAD